MQELATILTYMSIFTIDLHNERRQMTSYQTIRPMLFRYLYRQSTHQGKTKAWRCLLLSVLICRARMFSGAGGSESRGYITMKRGKLVSIDRPLPEAY